MIVFCQNVLNWAPTGFRNRLITELIQEQGADVCLFQEFGPNSTRVGEPPLQQLLEEAGYTEAYPEKAAGNFTPVFYKTAKYEREDVGYFMYDGLNDAGSKSVTWVLLRDKESGKRFVAAATHFWWMYEKEEDFRQRLQNVEQLWEICRNLTEKYGVPVVVGGDLNNGRNSDQGEAPYHAMLEKGFLDTRLTAPITTNSYTHHEYPIRHEDGTWTDGALPVRDLDYIFTYGPQVTTKRFDILLSQKALDSSDHCPLVAEIEL